jgi:HEAT repeat protein/TolB-like protein
MIQINGPRGVVWGILALIAGWICCPCLGASDLGKGATIPPALKIGVLPFLNNTPKASLDWLSIGFQDALTTDLSHIRGVEKFHWVELQKAGAQDNKDGKGSICVLRQKLGLNRVISGKIKAHGEEIQVDFEMMDASSGQRIHSSSVEGKPIALLAKASAWILEALAADGVCLSAQEIENVRSTKTNDENAWRLHADGLMYQLSFDHEKDRKAKADIIDKSVEKLCESVRVDPGYAEAWCSLGWSHIRKEDFKKAGDAFQKALWIKPFLVSALFGMGLVHEANKEYMLALESFKAGLLQNSATRCRFYWAGMDLDSVNLLFSEKVVYGDKLNELINLLLKSPSKNNRLTVLDMFAFRIPPPYVGANPLFHSVLFEVMYEENPRGLEYFGKIDFPRALDVLTGLLLKSHSTVARRNAAKSLAYLNDPKAVSSLGQAFQEPDETVRTEAAKALAAIGGNDAFQFLVQALDTTSGKTHDAVERALVTTMNKKPEIELIAELSNDKPLVRRLAAKVLFQRKSKTSIPALQASLADTDEMVRHYAAAGLVALGELVPPTIRIEAIRHGDMAVRMVLIRSVIDSPSVAYVPELVEALQDPDSTCRYYAVDALKATGDSGVVPHLLGALNDPDVAVVYNALSALSELAGPGAVPELLRIGTEDARRVADAIGGRTSVKELMAYLRDDDISMRQFAIRTIFLNREKGSLETFKKAMGDPDLTVRLYAAMGLHKLRGDVPSEIVLEAIEKGEAEVRSEAALALGEIPELDTTPVLAKALRDEYYCVCWAAAISLETRGDVRAVVPLIRVLDHKKSFVREGVAKTLGGIGDVRAVEALVDRLSDLNEKDQVRAAAAKALGSIRDPRAIPALVSALSDDDLYLRSAAIQSLGNLRVTSALDSIRPLLLDSEERVRAAAATSLGQLGDERDVPPLKKAMEDQSAEVRLKAAQALGRIGHHSALEVLMIALQDVNGDVRAAAAEALGLLGDPRAISALQQAKGTGWPVDEEAAFALKRISLKHPATQ